MGNRDVIFKGDYNVSVCNMHKLDIFNFDIHTCIFSTHTHTHIRIIKFCPYPVRAMRKFMNSVLVGISVLQTINAF